MARAAQWPEAWHVVLGLICLVAWALLARDSSSSLTLLAGLCSASSLRAIPLSLSFELALAFNIPALDYRLASACSRSEFCAATGTVDPSIRRRLFGGVDDRRLRSAGRLIHSCVDGTGADAKLRHRGRRRPAVASLARETMVP
jgi:hypothetical protein